MDVQKDTGEMDASADVLGRQVRLLRIWVIVLTAGVLAGAVSVWRAVRNPAGVLAPPVAAGPAAPSDVPAGTTRGAIGPWGQLQYTRIIIAPPIEFIEEAGLDIPPDQWVFSGIPYAELAAFLDTVPLTDEQRKLLLDRTEPLAGGGGFVTAPGADLVRSMSLDARRALYAKLSTYPQNERRGSFRFQGESLEEWFSGAPLQLATVEAVRPYVFRIGGFLFFRDLRTVLPSVPDEGERMRLVKALSRESTLLVKLVIPDDADIDRLVQYWGDRGRAKDVEPLLESVRAAAGERTIDVVHLLPPFARRRLYTYPLPSQEPASARRDCHWTAMNFFREAPDDAFTDLAHVGRTITEEYYDISSNPRYGDLVIFESEKGHVFFHSAVYIADGVIFTKNGARVSNPWMFMRIADMKDYYPGWGNVRVRFLRHK